MAGRARPVRAVVAGVRLVRMLAAARSVGPHRGRSSGPRRQRRKAFVAGVGGLDHLPRSHPRRGGPPGQHQSCCRRTRSPRAGTFPGRVGHQDPRRHRPTPRRAGVPADPRPGRRQPTDDPGPGDDPRRPARSGTATPTPPASAGRQGLLIQGQPRLAACPPDPHDHPRTGRPGRPPPTARLPRRQTTGLRPRHLQGPARRRVRLQHPQTPPRIRHPLRQARRPLRRNRPRRQHRPLAQTT